MDEVLVGQLRKHRNPRVEFHYEYRLALLQDILCMQRRLEHIFDYYCSIKDFPGAFTRKLSVGKQI